MSTVDDILKLLENGKWHSLNEIREKTKLHDLEVKSITEFLAQYNIIKLDKGVQKAKLNYATQDFLKKIRQIEGDEAR